MKKLFQNPKKKKKNTPIKVSILLKSLAINKRKISLDQIIVEKHIEEVQFSIKISNITIPDIKNYKVLNFIPSFISFQFTF